MTVAVSVVIPHYGAADQTIDLLNDLAGQQDAGSLEVIVADDASPDPFPLAVATAYNARLVRRESNGGFGSACNSGAEVACGDSLLFLNSDTRVGPRFIAELVASSMPFQPAVTGPAVMGHGEVVATGRRWVSARHYAAEWSIPFRKLRAAKGLPLDTARVNAAVPGQVVPVDWLFGVALLIPTEAFRRVGGFDERFFMNCEEMDLQRVLRRHGIPAVYAGTVTVTHAGGGSSDPAKRRAWVVQSRLHYAQKWGGPRARRRLQAALTAATAANLVWNTGRRLASRSVTPLATARTEWQLLSGRTPR